MKAILTRYFGATNHHSSRMVATAEGGKKPWRLTRGYDYELDSAGNHAAVAKALRDKMEWKGEMVGGSLPNGDMAWVFKEDSPRFNPRKRRPTKNPRNHPWAVYKRIAPGEGRSKWKFIKTSPNGIDASLEARRLWESTGIEHTASTNDGAKKNPMKKKSKRKPSPAQIAARKRFAQMARARSWVAKLTPQQRANRAALRGTSGPLEWGGRTTGPRGEKMNPHRRFAKSAKRAVRKLVKPFIAIEIRPGKIEFFAEAGVSQIRTEANPNRARKFNSVREANQAVNKVAYATQKRCAVVTGKTTMTDLKKLFAH